MPDPTPIFVLGKHRSGTTWLANQLCMHSMVAGVVHPRHFGIHESIYFSRVLGRHGDLGIERNFRAFTAEMSRSDYFRLAGASEEYLNSLWPCSYEELFRSVMDRFATTRNTCAWVEKSPSHTPRIAFLSRTYQDALFVAVERDLLAVVRSEIALAARSSEQLADSRWRGLAIARSAASWAYYRATLRRFECGSPRLLQVRYSEMLDNTPGVMGRVCDFLGLPFESAVCEDSPYRKNTSFTRWRSGFELSASDIRLARLVAGLFDRIPPATVRVLVRTRDKFRRSRSLPPFFFSMESLTDAQLVATGEQVAHPDPPAV